MRCFVIIFLCLLPLLARGTEKSRQAIYIHADCNGKISSMIVSSFTKAIRTSQKYHQVSSLDDEGHRGIVMTVYMACAEQAGTIGVASSYGWAKCYSEKECHLSVDGSSIQSVLCNGRNPSECGRELFKMLEDFIHNSGESMFAL